MTKTSRERSGMKSRLLEQYKKRRVINNAMITSAVGISKDLKLNIKYDNQLNKMMKMLQEIDPSFSVLPWDKESNEKRLHKKEDVPEYKEDLIKYVRDIRVIYHYNVCQMTYRCSFKVIHRDLFEKGRIIFQNNRGWIKK